MKLNFLHNQKEEPILEEFEDDSEIPMPYGYTPEEFTPDVITHLKRLKHRQPDLYKDIINGN
jgi:hypothetical protein